MPAVISKNTNYPAGLGQSILPNDSGSILGYGGKKLVDGTQQSATTLASDSTAGTTGNFLPPVSPNNTKPATITNLALTTNVVTITAANNFVAEQTVVLAGLTTTAALNGTVLIVSATGLSTSSFQAALTHTNIVSGAETGTATLQDVQAPEAGLSLAPGHE